MWAYLSSVTSKIGSKIGNLFAKPTDAQPEQFSNDYEFNGVNTGAPLILQTSGLLQMCEDGSGGVQGLATRHVVRDADGDEADEMLWIGKDGKLIKRVSAVPTLQPLPAETVIPSKRKKQQTASSPKAESVVAESKSTAPISKTKKGKKK